MATNDSMKTALANREEAPAALDTVRHRVEAMRPEFSKVLADSIGAERFVRVALTELRLNPQLERCTPESLLGALMTCAQLNLEPGRALGEAWLVPYGTEATFIVGYRGLIKLAWQSDRVLSIVAKSVCEHDTFSFSYGLNPRLDHDYPVRSARGPAYAWYAYALLKGGGSSFVVLGRDDVERIRARSKAKDSGPWKTDYDAMACKTAIRQLAKFLPMSTRFATAVAVDEQVRVDPAPVALDEQAHTMQVERVDEDLPL